MSETRYYRGWSREASDELSPEQARKLPSYSCAWLRADGSVERVERYDRGALAIVDYYDASGDDEIAPQHQAKYPGIARMVHRTLGRTGDYEWSAVVSTRGHGEFGRHSIVLSDGGGRWEIMSIDQDAAGDPMSITKYRFDDDHELLYAFEYRTDGRLISIHDFAGGGRASFDEVKHALPDPDFYETGFALPRSIAGTAIPLDVARKPETPR
jgi:hypothetical protein